MCNSIYYTYNIADFFIDKYINLNYLYMNYKIIINKIVMVILFFAYNRNFVIFKYYIMNKYFKNAIKLD